MPFNDGVSSIPGDAGGGGSLIHDSLLSSMPVDDGICGGFTSDSLLLSTSCDDGNKKECNKKECNQIKAKVEA